MLRTILFSVALASGGIAAWLVASIQPAETRVPEAAAAEPVAMEEVLVAAFDIEQGTPFLPEHARWQAWPADAVNQAFVLRSAQPDAVEKLGGSVLRGRIVAGEPIVAAKLAPARSSFLSAVLTPGMRAVAIRISAEKTAGGFILPNDRVDVLLTMPCRPEDGCNAAMAVRTILRNVRVLAIDQSGQESQEQGVLIGRTATLELDPAQAETLIAAEASGILSLVLRSAADHAEPRDAAAPERGRTVRIRREGVSEYVTIQ